MTFIRTAVWSTAWLVAFAAGSGLAAQDRSLAPVPPQIAAGKSIFLANGGADPTSEYVLAKGGDAARPYHLLYAALQGWNRYELVPTPGEADLVFEIRLTTTHRGSGLTLVILDGKTHFKLWTIPEAISPAARLKNYDKNVKKAVDQLLEDLKSITGAKRD